MGPEQNSRAVLCTAQLASATDWQLACGEALCCGPLWSALDLATVGAGAIGTAPLALETVRFGRQVAQNMAADDKAAAVIAGERLRALLRPGSMPRLAMCLAEGADGASLKHRLVACAAFSSRCERCGLHLSAQMRAQASDSLRAAGAASVDVLLRLGGHAADEDAEHCSDARGDVIERAGKGLRTIRLLSTCL
jgi:hypothetical protein